jgi:hypothetical protein
MKAALYKLSFLLFIPILAFLIGCEDSLTDANTNGIPDVGSGDSTNTAFVTIVSGSETGGPVGTIFRRNAAGPNLELGIFGPSGTSSLDLDVEPNITIPDTIEFEYSVSGEAVRGGDYELSPSSPALIEFDTSTTSIDSETLTASVLSEGDPGVTLTTETRTAEVTLESATTVNGTRDMEVGRGGTDVGVSRTFNVSPSITLTDASVVPLSSVSLDSTEVGETTAATLLVHNTSGINFEVSSFSATGPDASDFEVTGFSDNPVEPLSFAPNSPGPLPLNDFAEVSVEFTPQSAGDKTATLQFDVSNSSDDTTAEYEISAVAVSSGS